MPFSAYEHLTDTFVHPSNIFKVRRPDCFSAKEAWIYAVAPTFNVTDRLTAFEELFHEQTTLNSLWKIRTKVKRFCSTCHSSDRVCIVSHTGGLLSSDNAVNVDTPGVDTHNRRFKRKTANLPGCNRDVDITNAPLSAPRPAVKQRRRCNRGTSSEIKNYHASFSEAMLKTLSLTCPTTASIQKNLSVFRNVCHEMNNSGGRKRHKIGRVGTAAQAKQHLIDRLESTDYSEIALPLTQNIKLAPLRGSRVIIGDCVVRPFQILTLTGILPSDLLAAVGTLYISDAALVAALGRDDNGHFFDAETFLCDMLDEKWCAKLFALWWHHLDLEAFKSFQVHVRSDAFFIRVGMPTTPARDTVVDRLREIIKPLDWRVFTRIPKPFAECIFTSAAAGVRKILRRCPIFQSKGHLPTDTRHFRLYLLLWADNCQSLTAVRFRLVDPDSILFSGGGVSPVTSMFDLNGREEHLPPCIPEVVKSVSEVLTLTFTNADNLASASVVHTFFVGDHHCLNFYPAFQVVGPSIVMYLGTRCNCFGPAIRLMESLCLMLG